MRAVVAAGCSGRVLVGMGSVLLSGRVLRSACGGAGELRQRGGLLRVSQSGAWRERAQRRACGVGTQTTQSEEERGSDRSRECPSRSQPNSHQS